MAKQQGGGGRAGGSKGMQRMPLRPEDLGLPPGMSLDGLGAEAEITWELDEEDLADLEFEEGEEGEWEFDPETGGMSFTRAGILNEDGTITYQTSATVSAAAAAAAAGMGLLDTWHRTAVFREKTKKALGAVRRLAREGRITKLEKAKLIHSVITSTSHDEISQVEMAYDLLVKRGVGDLEEFAGALRRVAPRACGVLLMLVMLVMRGGVISLTNLNLSLSRPHPPTPVHTNNRPMQGHLGRVRVGLPVNRTRPEP